MSLTSPSRSVLGLQPSLALALLGSPRECQLPSAGNKRVNVYKVTVVQPDQCESFFTKLRTDLVCPVATT
jgi:hypothetical protein